MRFLVTGGAGYIGSHMTHQLLDLGHEVIVLDNLSTGFKELVPQNAKFILGDIADTDLITEILATGIDAVFHFAAYIRVDESVTNPGKYFENNTAKALKLIQAVAQSPNTMFIFSSTAAVYGNSDGSLDEHTQTQPLTAYGQSKLMTEQILKEMSLRHGFKAIALRYFNVAGAHQHGKSGQRSKNATHLIKVAAETACGKRPAISIYGTDYPTPDGTCIRDYIHVEDLCSAHIKAMEYLKNSPQGSSEFIFNLGYGHGYSVREVLATMQQSCQVQFKIEEAPRRAGDNINSIANPQKAIELLKWKPQFNDLGLICKSAFKYEQTLK